MNEISFRISSLRLNTSVDSRWVGLEFPNARRYLPPYNAFLIPIVRASLVGGAKLSSNTDMTEMKLLLEFLGISIFIRCSPNMRRSSDKLRGSVATVRLQVSNSVLRSGGSLRHASHSLAPSELMSPLHVSPTRWPLSKKRNKAQLNPVTFAVQHSREL